MKQASNLVLNFLNFLFKKSKKLGDLCALNSFPIFQFFSLLKVGEHKSSHKKTKNWFLGQTYIDTTANCFML